MVHSNFRIEILAIHALLRALGSVEIKATGVGMGSPTVGRVIGFLECIPATVFILSSREWSVTLHLQMHGAEATVDRGLV